MESRIATPSNRHRSVRGFTLLELAVVVTILGIISGIALPAYQKIQRNTRLGALINDYRVFTSAFQQYSAVNAAWPAYSGTQGAFPAGMEEYLRTTNWSQPTAFGGRYNWEQDVTHNGRKVKAAIAIYGADDRPLTMTASEMEVFDERYDDGNLTSGYFQKGYQDCPLYIIEDDPLYAAAGPGPGAAEASIDDVAGLPDQDQQAAEEAARKAAAEKAAKEAAEKAAAEKAAREAAEKAAAEAAAKEAADKDAKEKADKDAAEEAARKEAEKAAAEKAAKDKAAKEAAEKAAKEKADKEAADKAAADKAAADKAAKEAADKAAAEEAAKNTPAAKAEASYNSLVSRAAAAKVNVPNSVTNAVNKLKEAAAELAATDPADTKALTKNTNAYDNAQKQAANALESFDKTVTKAEAKQ